MSVRFSDVEFARLKKLLIVYEWSQQIFMTKLNILSQDLKNFHDDNPIEHIKGRIKAPENIAQKLFKMDLDITADNAKKYLTDISGVRIICPFAKDIHSLVDILSSMPDWKVLEQKDYITHPKPSGYRSFHLIIEIPVYYSGKTEGVPVEVQIRTAAMDFWATMEHKVRYKYNEHVPQHLCDELVVCADKIDELDKRMLLIQEIISLINQD
ncbi:MAG: GTP pyrophosphokinase family protein [Oscillospiraceae bacterium]|nr:GTP pyrophosphokinase family protein [Oscillospiraceae bacterium]